MKTFLRQYMVAIVAALCEVAIPLAAAAAGKDVRLLVYLLPLALVAVHLLLIQTKAPERYLNHWLWSGVVVLVTAVSLVVAL